MPLAHGSHSTVWEAYPDTSRVRNVCRVEPFRLEYGIDMWCGVATASLAPAPRPFVLQRVAHGGEMYSVGVQPAAVGTRRPPLVLVPPVGVGIDRRFYDRLHQAWEDVGAPAPMHSLDLLGTGDASPKPRRFYSPDVWADQLDAYIRKQLREPCVLVVQGGLLPCALEVWRRSGRDAIVGVSLLSPPPLRFFTTAGAPAGPIEAEKPLAPVLAPARPRRAQRISWSIACSPVGNLFYRRLRGGRPRGRRIREFTEHSLFAVAEAVDDEWVANCVRGSLDARSRFSTFSYLCGSIPQDGAWRDERGDLFDSLDVPLQLLRGDYGGEENAREGADSILKRAPCPSRECSAIIRGSRACVPYEQPRPTAALLAKFVAVHFGGSNERPPPGAAEGAGSFLNESESFLLLN